MTAEEFKLYMLLVRRDKIFRVKKGRQRSLKQSNREQIHFWFCNVDTLTTEKCSELKSTLSPAEKLPYITASLIEAKLRYSIVTWSAVCHNLGARAKDTNMSQNEGRRQMIVYLCKVSENNDFKEAKVSERTQLYEVLLDAGNVVIASVHRNPLSSKELTDKLNSFLKKLGDSRIKIHLFW